MATFSGSVHAFVHPGIYMRELSVRQFRELDHRMNQNPSLGLLQRLYDPTNSTPINLGNLGADLPRGFQEKLFWTLEKDLTEPHYRDRVNHSAALEFLKEISKPLSEFTLQEFHSLLCSLYQKILDPSQREGENSYRKEAICISTKNFHLGGMIEAIKKGRTREEGLRLVDIMERLQSESWEEMKKTLSEQEIRTIEEFFIPCPLPREIPGLIEQFHRDLAQKFRNHEDSFAIAGFAHMRLAKIHPFSDGNGRIARLMMNLILLQAGYSPIAFASDAEYTAALKKGEASFIAFIKKNVAQLEYEEVVDLLLKKRKETFEKTLQIAQQLLYDPLRLRIFRAIIDAF